jgi:hypothetical protein
MEDGDSFFSFRTEAFGPGYEIQKHWILRVRGDGRYDYAGGAVGGTETLGRLPYPLADVDPKKAFAKGKKLYLKSVKDEKERLRKQIEKLTAQGKKLRAVKVRDVKIRGGNETFEQFKRNWDSDF